MHVKSQVNEFSKIITKVVRLKNACKTQCPSNVSDDSLVDDAIMGWVPNKEVYIFEHANDIYGTEV